MKNSFFAGLLVIAMVLFVSFWDSPPEMFLGKEKEKEAAASKANSYMTQSTTRKFDEFGQLAFVLNTTQGQFFKGQNRFVVDQPQITSSGTDADEAFWHMTAKTGVVFNRGERIVMRGDVHAWQEAPPDASHFKTPKLTYYPEKEIAETDHSVIISSPGSRVSGVGMKANLAKQTFHLLAQVKSRHDVIN